MQSPAPEAAEYRQLPADHHELAADNRQHNRQLGDPTQPAGKSADEEFEAPYGVYYKRELVQQFGRKDSTTAANHTQADGAIGVPAALVSAFALTMLQSEMKDSHAEDYASTCSHYGSLRTVQLVTMALAGAAAMIAVTISASVYFVGIKLSLDPALWHWWFFGIVNWRVRSRRCFELSLPLLMMAIALQPEAWCEEQMAAILILAIFSSAAAFLAFFSWFIVPVSAPVTTLADWHKRVTSEAHDEGSSHRGGDPTWAWKY